MIHDVYPDIDIEEIKRFRQLGSKTAGHPEYGHAAGIETTTGPLGQGIANAVGMALTERMLAARYGDALVDHHTYVFVGDGCLMEGIGQEAISLAGNLRLSKSVLVAKLYLVRHGEAAASWGEDPDPGLSDLGRGQAARMAAAMAPLGPLAIMVSPLQRTRETAQPLEAAWNITGVVEPAVREVPSPTEDLSNRREWLREIMAGTWAQADAWLQPWRQGMIDTLLGVPVDSVIVSHFVAINVAVGAAQGDNRVTLFRPNNCSITVLESDGHDLTLVELGEALETDVG